MIKQNPLPPVGTVHFTRMMDESLVDKGSMFRIVKVYGNYEYPHKVWYDVHYETIFGKGQFIKRFTHQRYARRYVAQLYSTL